MHRSAWLKRHLLLVWTTDALLLPIEFEGRLEKARAIADRPGFAVDHQISRPLAHQRATEIGPIDVPFPQLRLLSHQVSTDLLGHAGFWGIGERNADRTHESAVQIVQHMSFVAINAHAAALASVTHLGIFDADAPLFGHAFA